MAVDDKASWKVIRTLAEDNKIDVTPLITKSKKVVTDDTKQDTTTEEKSTVTATVTDSADDSEYIV